MSDLNVSSMMPFGKYRNWPLANIPANYFVKIYSQKDMMDLYPDLKQYIEQQCAALLPVSKGLKELVPVCESLKICYVDEEAAMKALKLINQDKRDHTKPKRAYECPLCGYWHHTKK